MQAPFTTERIATIRDGFVGDTLLGSSGVTAEEVALLAEDELKQVELSLTRLQRFIAMYRRVLHGLRWWVRPFDCSIEIACLSLYGAPPPDEIAKRWPKAKWIRRRRPDAQDAPRHWQTEITGVTIRLLGASKPVPPPVRWEPCHA